MYRSVTYCSSWKCRNVEKEKSGNGVHTKASHYKWFSFRVCSPGSHETCADICTARLKHPHLARKSPHCGLVTRAVSGQVMHATGSMEDGPVLELCYIEKNPVCRRTRTSYGALGLRPGLNSPGLYFVFKCLIHLSHPCSTGFCAQNSDEALRYQNMNEGARGGLKKKKNGVRLRCVDGEPVTSLVSVRGKRNEVNLVRHLLNARGQTVGRTF